MKRTTIVKAHLALASAFLPFLLLMPLTGALDLIGIDGTQTKTPAFESADALPEDKNQHEEFFREQFKKQGLDFDFEYIRANGKDFTFRPSSRVHYVATSTPTGLAFSKVEPNLQKRLFEIHKGHGPRLMKWIEVAFGLALILATLSGVWLALTSTPYRKVLLISFSLGLLAIVVALA